MHWAGSEQAEPVEEEQGHHDHDAHVEQEVHDIRITLWLLLPVHHQQLINLIQATEDDIARIDVGLCSIDNLNTHIGFLHHKGIIVAVTYS